jgi:hypothetical protein
LIFKVADIHDQSSGCFDPKERSKERKKNVEMNRTDDKRSNAMAMLKARREGKQKRGIKYFHLYIKVERNRNPQ